jgi:hypothetical protein
MGMYLVSLIQAIDYTLIVRFLVGAAFNTIQLTALRYFDFVNNNQSLLIIKDIERYCKFMIPAVIILLSGPSGDKNYFLPRLLRL